MPSFVRRRVDPARPPVVEFFTHPSFGKNTESFPTLFGVLKKYVTMFQKAEFSAIQPSKARHVEEVESIFFSRQKTYCMLPDPLHDRWASSTTPGPERSFQRKVNLHPGT